MNDHIIEFWEQQAKLYGTSYEASWADNWAIALEIDTIARHLKDGDRVLDVGCANGYSTCKQVERHALEKIIGIDFSERMIAAAVRAKIECQIGDELEFRVGNVLNLDFEDGCFDRVYSTRVLINLPTWEAQKKGILECLRVVRPGGRVILSEAFWEPLQLLNAMRALKQMPPLIEHDFNRYLKKRYLEAWLKSEQLSYEIEEFSSVYYLGSRFLRELITDSAAYPGYSNPINKLFHDLEVDYSGGGFGIQQAYVIHKP